MEQRSSLERPLTLPSPVWRGVPRQGNGLARPRSHRSGHTRSVRSPLQTGEGRVRGRSSGNVSSPHNTVRAPSGIGLRHNGIGKTPLWHPLMARVCTPGTCRQANMTPVNAWRLCGKAWTPSNLLQENSMPCRDRRVSLAGRHGMVPSHLDLGGAHSVLWSEPPEGTCPRRSASARRIGAYRRAMMTFGSKAAFPG